MVRKPNKQKTYNNYRQYLTDLDGMGRTWTKCESQLLQCENHLLSHVLRPNFPTSFSLLHKREHFQGLVHSGLPGLQQQHGCSGASSSRRHGSKWLTGRSLVDPPGATAGKQPPHSPVECKESLQCHWVTEWK